jgi:hypothetical protein
MLNAENDEWGNVESAFPYSALSGDDYLTVSVPFMPAAKWPGKLQMNS